MNKLSNFLIGLGTAAVCAFSPIAPTATPAYAYQIRISPDGNWIYEGGLNRFDDTVVESTEEGKELEQRLIGLGYIEINDLTDEQYEAFVTNEDTDWWFEQYTNFSDTKYAEFYEGWYKIFIYYPSFEDWWEGYSWNKSVSGASRISKMEIATNSVVIDYRAWWIKERIGTDVSEEINEGIPSWNDTGYVTIVSPIDAEVRLELNDDHTYYTLYMRKNIPFRVKLKKGLYRVSEINGVSIKEDESSLYKNNHFQVGVGDSESEDTPMTMAVEKTVEAYNIEPYEGIDDMPDRSLDKNQELSGVEKTIIEEGTENTEETAVTSGNESFFRKLFLIIIAVCACGLAGVYFMLRKRRG